MLKSPQFGMTLATGLALGLGLGIWLGRRAHNVGLGSAPVSGGQVHDPRPPAGIRQPVLAGIGQKLRSGKDWQTFTGNAQDLLDRALAIPGERDTVYFLYRALEEIPAEQLPRFAAELIEIPSSIPHQLTALLEVQRLWAQQDPAAALAWAQGLPAPQRKVAMCNAVAALAESNPEEAQRLVATLPTAAERNEAMGLIADRLSESDPAAAFALLRTIPNAENSGYGYTLMSNWARRDPIAAAAALSKMSAEAQRTYTSQIFQIWGETDPAAALAAAGKMDNLSARRQASSSALNAWAQRDPKAAAEWFQALPAAEQCNADVSKVLAPLAGKDPQAAIALLANIKGQTRINAMSSIANAWGANDPDAAWRWAQSLTSVAEQTSAIHSLASAMRDEDPTKILAHAEQLTNHSLKLQFLKQSLGASSHVEVAKLAEVFQKLAPDEIREVINDPNVEGYAARTDPAGTSRLLMAAGLGPLEGAWSILAQSYATQDPAAAFEWAATLPQEYQDRMMSTILPQLALADAPGALLRAQAMTNESQRRNVIANVMSQWAGADPISFEQAVPQMQGDQRTAAMEQLISRKISDDPPSAATYLLNLQQSGREEDVKIATQTAGNLAAQWAQTDPKAAAAWAPQLPEGPTRDSFITDLAANWVAADTMAASAWIKELPVGSSKDRSVSHLINSIRESDPESALIWAGQIQNQSSRESAYQEVLGALLQKDAAAGQRAVEAAPISPELKQSLLNNK